MRHRLPWNTLLAIYAFVATLGHASASVREAQDARDECEANGCTPERHVQLLVDLGDAHLETKADAVLADEDVDGAIAAFEQAAQLSFDDAGADSESHSLALLRLANAYLSKGEYQEAHRLYAGWLRTHGEATDDAKRGEALRVLAKHAVGAALAEQDQLATRTLDAALKLHDDLAELSLKRRLAKEKYAKMMGDGMAAMPEAPLGLSAHEHARLLMVLGVLQRHVHEEAALRHVTAALALHANATNATDAAAADADAADMRALERSMCSSLRVALLFQTAAFGGELEDTIAETYDLQAAAAAASGHTVEDGQAEALFNAYVAALRREGRTEAAARHMAVFFGNTAYEMVPPERDEDDVGELSEEEERERAEALAAVQRVADRNLARREQQGAQDKEEL